MRDRLLWLSLLSFGSTAAAPTGRIGILGPPIPPWMQPSRLGASDNVQRVTGGEAEAYREASTKKAPSRIISKVEAGREVPSHAKPRNGKAPFT